MHLETMNNDEQVQRAILNAEFNSALELMLSLSDIVNSNLTLEQKFAELQGEVELKLISSLEKIKEFGGDQYIDNDVLSIKELFQV